MIKLNPLKGGVILAKAIYPGSFDPVTNGHLDIIDRASKVFEHLIVAVLENPRKDVMFSMNERVQMLESVIDCYDNVEVICHQGLLVDFAQKQGVSIIIKGLRAISDFEFEFQMALVNRKLNCDVETMLMVTNNMYSYVSSSIVKEVASYGGDIRDFVPSKVYTMIKNKIFERIHNK